MWVELQQDYQMDKIVMMEDTVSARQKQLAELKEHNVFRRQIRDVAAEALTKTARADHHQERMYRLNDSLHKASATYRKQREEVATESKKTIM